MSEPQIAPSRARVALAARAGLRASSPWSVPAALCLVAAAALPSETRGWPWSAGELWDLVFRTWSIVLVGALVVAVAAVAASGGLGWRTREVRLGRVGRVRRSIGGQALVGAVVFALALLALRGAPAGAARAVDASDVGLIGLWLSWSRRALVAIGLASLAGGAIDLWLGRRALWRALHQTRAEARER